MTPVQHRCLSLSPLRSVPRPTSLSPLTAPTNVIAHRLHPALATPLPLSLASPVGSDGGDGEGQQIWRVAVARGDSEGRTTSGHGDGNNIGVGERVDIWAHMSCLMV